MDLDNLVKMCARLRLGHVRRGDTRAQASGLRNARATSLPNVCVEGGGGGGDHACAWIPGSRIGPAQVGSVVVRVYTAPVMCGRRGQARQHCC